MPLVTMIRPRVFRIGQLALGGLLIVAAPILTPVPGPAGIFLFAGGMVLILRNSRKARRRWARLKRRWPRTGHLVDRFMRRPSALRRQGRIKASGTESSIPTDAHARSVN